jgi:hypothetical protein
MLPRNRPSLVIEVDFAPGGIDHLANTDTSEREHFTGVGTRHSAGPFGALLSAATHHAVEVVLDPVTAKLNLSSKLLARLGDRNGSSAIDVDELRLIGEARSDKEILEDALTKWRACVDGFWMSLIDPKRSWNRLAAETTIARVDLSTDSGSIGPGR